MYHRVPRTSIYDIPVEVLTDIIARVAESDPINMTVAQLTCKRFLLAGDTKEVYSRVALDFFAYNLETFGKEETMFVQKCFQTENPEAIFRKGMILYFTLGDKASGVIQLRRAIDKGHLPAVYAMEMIKISEGLLASNEGCDLLNALYDLVGDSWEFKNFSSVVSLVLHYIRHRNIAFTNQHWNVNCPIREHNLERILKVGFGIDDETEACRFCKWYRRFQLLVKIVKERIV